MSLNQAYGDHFVELSDREEIAERNLLSLQEELPKQKEKHQTLLAEFPKAIEDENRRLRSLESLSNEGSRTEKYLLTGQINGYSPLNLCELMISNQEKTIGSLTKQIEVAKNEVQSAKADISLTVQELRILNKIIETRREAVKTEQLSEINARTDTTDLHLSIRPC